MRFEGAFADDLEVIREHVERDMRVRNEKVLTYYILVSGKAQRGHLSGKNSVPNIVAQ